MKYDNIREGRFIARLNRFVAEVELAGRAELCHVKNTGRLKELLLPGAVVLLQASGKSGRKTAYDLISVYKGRRLVNIDSQATNKVAAEYLPRFFLKSWNSGQKQNTEIPASTITWKLLSTGFSSKSRGLL